jgi:hypothetical protein
VTKGSTCLSACLALCFTSFAQTKLPNQKMGPNPFGHVKLLEDFVRADGSAKVVPNPFGHVKLIEDFARADQSAPVLRPRKPIYKMSDASRASADSPCAHIIIKRPTRDIDPKILRRVPEDPTPFPKYSGLPQCLQDVR